MRHLLRQVPARAASLLSLLLLSPAALGQSAGVDSEASGTHPRYQDANGQLDPAFDRDLILGDDAREQFSLHRLNYAAVGNHDLKLQLSFKYRFLEQVPAFISFTNTTAWDIYEPNDPARDTLYNPEVFYRWRLDDARASFVDAGFWHASNGRGDTPEKRSLDRFFVRGIFDRKVFGRSLLATPTAYLPVSESKHSKSITSFVGRWDLGLVWKDLISPDKPGSDIDFFVDIVDPITAEGSYTFGLQIRLEDYLWSPNIYIQYFTGYGDTLLEYNERKTELRFGMSFYY